MTLLTPAQTTSHLPPITNDVPSGNNPAVSASTENAPSSKTHTPQELAVKLLANHSAFENPNYPDRISNAYLKVIATGKLVDGRDATPEQVELAKELLNNPETFDAIDGIGSGYKDGTLSWNDMAVAAGQFDSISDRSLLVQTRVYFREFAAGANDQYVNFNELREAAGEIPSTRTFSTPAKAVAKELLNRPELLRKLDIGVGFLGVFSGKQDDRFDLTNIDYMRGRSSDIPRSH
ncbi:hypothetical protein [Pseudomonas sp. MWU16-30323]|uniref:hypothetical protein n=1 Tax=Pseudomonas sp. MWU16-30323 TaxID=2878094 RepID=UPI001CFB4CAE|nr:hypothetical protein [Pseudomonas sp. MWU16-30323]